MLLLAARARMNHIVSASYVDAILADSPAGYWRLDEATGTVAADSAGNGQDGVYVGSPTMDQASLLPSGGGAAVKFTGATQYMQLPALGSAIGDFTAELWFKSSSPASGGDALARSDETYSATSLPAGVFLDAHGSNSVRLGLRITNGGNFVFISDGTNLGDGVAHHLVYTRNATTGACAIYIDGVAKSSGNLTTGTVTLNSSSHWWVRRFWQGIGYSSTSSTATMDEIAIYDHVLTAERVAAHYSAGTTA